MSFLTELEDENVKSGLFTEFDTGVSYPLGIPMIDQQLGFKQEIVLPDGSTYTQTRLGAPAGTFSMFIGPSSSFKSATAIQCGWNIVEPFGEDAGLVVIDAENSMEYQRLYDLLGVSKYEMEKRIKRIDEPTHMTYESILDMMVAIGKKKESDKKRYTYNTGFKSAKTGEDIIYYIPTVIVIDSLLRITSKNDDLTEIPGLTSGGRDAIVRGKWYRNCLAYTRKYNINVIVINHLGNAMQLTPGSGGPKQLTFIPTGKNVPGGDKAVFYTSSMLAFQPVNSKDEILTEEVNGYNGVSVKVAVCKSRSGPGGKTATLHYIQEAGLDIRLSLMNIAKENGLISGRNPSCYFVDNPDIKFDTRIFLKELTDKPEMVRALYANCKPYLANLVRDVADENDVIRGANTKINARQMLRDIY